MLFKWKLAIKLGLIDNFLKDFDSTKDFDDDDKENNDILNFRRRFDPNSPGTPHKPIKLWGQRAIVVIVVATILYFIFGYGAPSYIEVKSIECSDKKLKITSTHSKDYLLPEFAKNNHGSYANKISMGNHDLYEVYLYTERSSKIAFRVSKTLVSDNTNGSKWVYQVPLGLTYSRLVECKNPPNNCCCCTNGKQTCDCGCTVSNGSCTCSSTSSNGCACCAFMQWIDLAVLNLESPGKITPAGFLLTLAPSIIYIILFTVFTRWFMKNQSGLFKMGQSFAKVVKFQLSFNEVAGLHEEKEELKEIVSYLKSPHKYKSAGARLPKGVILYGPPGTGKTLLAKAVSGEAGVPFIEVAGSTFDDMFVGSGAKRVRELFVQAKKVAPCIIFIDEIDAVAGKRGNKFVLGGGGGAHDQTINQLLSELDGFNTAKGIVVMAATNRLESIDEAILRPGRFDRHIQINLPNIKDRVEILNIHANNKNLSSSVDLEDVARKTPGFSGAQLENILNEATLLAVRDNKRVVTQNYIDEAIDRTIGGGPAKKSHRMSDAERKQVAYHEAGHAIAGLYVHEGEVVEKVTIIPRGKAAGYMLSAPEKQETFIKRKDELLSMIVTTLAGRASEELFFGPEKISSGAANDLFKATRVAREMVTKLGMSDKLGLHQLEPSEDAENPYKNNYSERTSQLIDQEIDELIEEQYRKSKKIISEHKEELLLIVECLLLIETIDKKQINYIHENMQLPLEAKTTKSRLKTSGKDIDLSPNSEKIIVDV